MILFVTVATALNRQHLLLIFIYLSLQSFIKELLSLEHSLMQSCEEVFGPLEHIFVELGRVMTWHTLVPDVDDD